jgi:superfamily II DNA or RNA helicase
MIIFEIDNCYTKVLGATEIQLKEIQNICTARYPSFFRAVKCECGNDVPFMKWMINKQNIKCFKCKEIIDLQNIKPKTVMKMNKIELHTLHLVPTGLMFKIMEYLNNNKIEFEIVDNRLFKPRIPIENKAFAPYDYQADAINCAKIRSRGIIHVPCSGGKTVMMAHIIFNSCLPALVIVPSIFLLEQTYERFKEWSKGAYVGKIGEGVFDPSDITIATEQTINSRINSIEMKEFLKEINTLCADEIHHVSFNDLSNQGNTWYSILMNTNAYYRYGFTATLGKPNSPERLFLEAAIGNVIFTVKVEDLVKGGYISKPIVEIYIVEHELLESDNWLKTEKEAIINNTVRNKMITDIALKHRENNSIVLVSVNKKEHGKILQETIEGSLFIHGTTKVEERTDAFDRFKKGELKILVTTLLKEGADIPIIGVMINAGGGKNDKGVIQKAGRTLRKTEDRNVEEFGIIVDFMDNGIDILKKHSQERILAYKKEGYDISEKDINYAVSKVQLINEKE